MEAGAIGRALERRERDACGIGGAVALFGEPGGALFHNLGELLGLGDFVDETPVFGALAANAIGIGAEDVGTIPADFALVRQASEAAGAGENAEQGQLGQTNGGGPVIHQDNFVAGRASS